MNEKNKKPSVLKFRGMIHILATTEKFVARDNFVINVGDDAPVKIRGLGAMFRRYFLGKVENPEDACFLSHHSLLRGSVDGPIITKLGGEERVETTLTKLFSLMKKQGNGETGVLLSNNRGINIFYIRSVFDNLCVVYCWWHKDGWAVYATPLKVDHCWPDGSLVFSNNLQV